MAKNIVWRLLRRNISGGQIAGYALANLVGLAIVLTAIQFYRDVTTVWDDEDSFISKDYMVISKKVNGLGSFLGGDGSTTFSEDEIADIASRPWAKKVGRFSSAAFNVYAKVNIGG
ncbi:MAG: ABC transporter permease, partial [Duncaniella sp.]|nr:ABC transporter permease [Duncaniella sp.]